MKREKTQKKVKETKKKKKTDSERNKTKYEEENKTLESRVNDFHYFDILVYFSYLSSY